MANDMLVYVPSKRMVLVDFILLRLMLALITEGLARELLVPRHLTRSRTFATTDGDDADEDMAAARMGGEKGGNDVGLGLAAKAWWRLLWRHAGCCAMNAGRHVGELQ